VAHRFSFVFDKFLLLTHSPAQQIAFITLASRAPGRTIKISRRLGGWRENARAALGCKLNYSLHPSASRAIEVRAIKPLSATPSGKSTHAGNKHH